MADRFLGRRLLAAVRLRRWELRIERAAKAALDKRKAHALAVTRTMTAASLPANAFGLEEWDGDVASEVEPVVAAVLDEMGNATLKFFALSPAERAAILGRIDLGSMSVTFTDRIKGLGNIAADRLAAALQEGIGLGEGIPKLADRIEAVFDKVASSAETIARTETHGAAEYTSYSTATEVSAAGIALTKSWLSAGDDRVRPSHEDAEADNEAVPIDEPFIVGGEELMFPGDPDGSAEETVSCRCTAIFEEAAGDLTPEEQALADEAAAAEE